jgi:hypothetical protein
MVLFPGSVFRDAARPHERKPAAISCYMVRLSAGYQSGGIIRGSERLLHLFMVVGLGSFHHSIRAR